MIEDLALEEWVTVLLVDMVHINYLPSALNPPSPVFVEEIELAASRNNWQHLQKPPNALWY